MLVTALSGCDFLPAEVDAAWKQLLAEVNALQVVFTGGQNPLPQKQPPKSTNVPAEVGNDGLSTPQGKAAKANAETMQEVYKVVFIKDAANREKFGEWVDTLNQGASFEGIYNGFTHSAFYRQVENSIPNTTPQAVKAFSEELAHLEMELPTQSEFDAESAKPLATLGELTPSDLAPDSASAKPQAQPTLNEATLIEVYSNLFAKASIFTLKRVLGDEALKVIAFKKSQGTLAAWYGHWVVHMAERHVDFGIALRNKADEQFHIQWAGSVSEDRLIWEVLNRLHRVLNEAVEPKAAPSPQGTAQGTGKGTS